MAVQFVKINEIRVPVYRCAPQEFKGAFTGKTCAGIDFDFTAGDNVVPQVDELFRQTWVTVEDPFVGRTYKATIERISTATSSSWQGKNYVGKLREIDAIKPFERLEIEGASYEVLRYKERIYNGRITREAILRLSREEYLQLHKLVQQKPERVHVRRIGVDDVALEFPVPALMGWSQHTDEDATYYKQDVRIQDPKPEDSSDVNPFNFLWSIVANVGRIAVTVTGRYEALLSDLVQAGVITEARKAELLDSGIDQLLGEERSLDVRLMASEVDDPEEEWDET